MSDKPVKVLVCIPRGGFSLTEAIDNQLEMMLHFGRLHGEKKFHFAMLTIGRVFVPKAREEFAKYAIEHGYDYLLMIDDDMICPPDMFEKLYAHNVDIVAPLAFQRRSPYYPVIYKQKSGWDSVRKEKFFSNEIVKNYPKNTLFQCDAVGFGAVLIKTEVLKAMPEPRFMSSTPTGEDILFCYNAREHLDAKVYVDTSIKIGHLGTPHVVTEEDFEKVNKMEEVREYHGDYSDDNEGVVNE